MLLWTYVLLPGDVSPMVCSGSHHAGGSPHREVLPTSEVFLQKEHLRKSEKRSTGDTTLPSHTCSAATAPSHSGVKVQISGSGTSLL